MKQQIDRLTDAMSSEHPADGFSAQLHFGAIRLTDGERDAYIRYQAAMREHDDPDAGIFAEETGVQDAAWIVDVAGQQMHCASYADALRYAEAHMADAPAGRTAEQIIECAILRDEVQSLDDDGIELVSAAIRAAVPGAPDADSAQAIARERIPAGPFREFYQAAVSSAIKASF